MPIASARSMRIFVAGATGVVGRRAVALLIAAGHPVTASGRNPDKLKTLVRRGAAAVNVDLFDASAVRRAVADHDVVINLATSIPTTSRLFLPGAWRETDRLRENASRILAEAAIGAGAQRFIQESYAPTYPDHGAEWIDETMPISPSRYNRTVIDAEASAQAVTRSGRAGVVLRFGAFYGPD